MATETKETVAIIDDDREICEGLAALIQTMGMDCHVSLSAEEFFERRDELRPSCVVSDLRLPGMNGLDLIERLNSEEGAPPVIILSAYATVPLAVRIMREGAFTVIEKPCRPQEVYETIHAAIARYRAELEDALAQQDRRRRFAQLTSSEIAVAAGMANGVSNAALAARLNLGLRTIEKRRQQVFKKLGINALPALVEFIYRAAPQLLEPDDFRDSGEAMADAS